MQGLGKISSVGRKGEAKIPLAPNRWIVSFSRELNGGINCFTPFTEFVLFDAGGGAAAVTNHLFQCGRNNTGEPIIVRTFGFVVRKTAHSAQAGSEYTQRIDASDYGIDITDTQVAKESPEYNLFQMQHGPVSSDQPFNERFRYIFNPDFSGTSGQFPGQSATLTFIVQLPVGFQFRLNTKNLWQVGDAWDPQPVCRVQPFYMSEDTGLPAM